MIGHEQTGNETRVLCVDLDGTLVRTDTFVESVLLLMRQAPRRAALVPLWLLRGRAHAKKRAAEVAPLDVALLPYREEVLDLLRQERASGRRIVLATAADKRVADAVADHVGLFDDVLASDGRTNCKSTAKLDAIRDRLGDAAFDYIGDSRSDLPIWRHTGRALLVAPGRSLERAVTRELGPPEVVAPRAPRWRELMRAVRPTQWTKNILIAVPMLASHKLGSGNIVAVTQALIAFCLAASGGYVVNDLLDLEADRAHPIKRARPFASGRLPPRVGILLAPTLIGLALMLSARLLPLELTGVLAAYVVVSIAYSIRFKRALLIDVLILAGLYTVRIFAGGLAIGIWPSFWLLAFCVFMFLGLAFVKRYAELRLLSADERDAASGRGYRVSDMNLILVLGVNSSFMSVVVFCFYINRADITSLYPRPELLWFAAPLLLYWVCRVWMLAERDQMIGDPLAWALTDRRSYVVVLVAGLIAWLAASV